jgi:Skp family chaperone for outer membrane proteins
MIVQPIVAVRRLVLALAAAVFAVPVAAQQLPPAVIAVINMQVLLEESSAAKSIRSQVEKLRTDFQEEVNRQDQRLREQEQELKRQQAVLATEAFNAKRRDFQQQVAKAQQDVQTRLRELDELAARGLNDVRRALLPILVDLSKEQGYNIVFANTQLVFASKQLDITDEVLKRINTSLPAVNLQAEPRAGAPAPAAAPTKGGSAPQGARTGATTTKGGPAPQGQTPPAAGQPQRKTN